MADTGRSAAWKLRAEEAQRAAEGIFARGPQRTASPASIVGPSREVAHKLIDDQYDRAAPHQLRVRRYLERASAADQGVFLQHPDDEEMHEFLSDSNNQEAFRQAASEGRLKVLKAGQSFALPNENRAT